jgi:hypothetical protein
MDHRDPPPPGASEPRPREAAAGPAHARPFARWVASPAARRPAPSRLALGAVVAVAALWLLAAGGSRTVSALVAWLHDRQIYQRDFREIEIPEPPPWIKSGRVGLLEQVRTQAGEPERLRVPGHDLVRIERAFQLQSPWVDRVDGITRAYPNRLFVQLHYRKPVAVAWWDAPEVGLGGRLRLVVDRDTVILPNDDLDLASAGPLIRIVGAKPPVDPRPGRFWGTGDATGDLAQPDPDVAAAARLAEFWQDRKLRPPSARPDVKIAAIHTGHPSGLFVQMSDETMILWREAPGTEPPRGLSADEKWAALGDWYAHHHHMTVKNPDYLEFTRHGVRRHLEATRAAD